MKISNADLILNNGKAMPTIGLGTWKSEPNKIGKAIEYAITECGYRHIDCAAIYCNEKEIGQSFKKVFKNKTVKREDIFITSKLWNTEHSRDNVLKACKSTLTDLNLEYLDLYLMHWGIATPPDTKALGGIERWAERVDENGVLLTEKVSIRETWQAMEDLVEVGLVKAIGVANFTAPMLIDLLSFCKIKPAINQIELHPYLQQAKLIDFCRYNNITVTAYSPLGSPGNYGDKSFMVPIKDEIINKIAKDHKKTPAQIMIRWGIQRKTIVIPKSVTPERIKENIDVFDFALSEEEIKIIAGLNKNLRFVDPYEWWKIPYFE